MISSNVARGLIRYGLPALAILLSVTAFQLWRSDVRRDARQEALAQDRTDRVTQTLNQMEKANAVRSQINDPASRARHDECVRSARTPENCQRFLPQ